MKRLKNGTMEPCKGVGHVRDVWRTCEQWKVLTCLLSSAISESFALYTAKLPQGSIKCYMGVCWEGGAG